ncbi:MAG TPA: phosphoribosylformylglycinamidine synthase subunit PurS [Candidatus Cloacimonas acidaminovorans]|nr:phosphoribosylformylglycinamidine synthase subunit PurS [Candidatus Cloacimonas acidaminovorans]
MKGLAMLKAKIYVQLKANVLDPQGKAVTNSLHNLGYTDVIETRISKYIEMSFRNDNREKVSQEVEKICQDLLANPNTETYHYEIISEE